MSQVVNSHLKMLTINREVRDQILLNAIVTHAPDAGFANNNYWFRQLLEGSPTEIKDFSINEPTFGALLLTSKAMHCFTIAAVQHPFISSTLMLPISNNYQPLEPQTIHPELRRLIKSMAIPIDLPTDWYSYAGIPAVVLAPLYFPHLTRVTLHVVNPKVFQEHMTKGVGSRAQKINSVSGRMHAIADTFSACYGGHRIKVELAGSSLCMGLGACDHRDCVKTLVECAVECAKLRSSRGPRRSLPPINPANPPPGANFPHAAQGPFGGVNSLGAQHEDSVRKTLEAEAKTVELLREEIGVIE